MNGLGDFLLALGFGWPIIMEVLLPDCEDIMILVVILSFWVWFLENLPKDEEVFNVLPSELEFLRSISGETIFKYLLLYN